MEESILTEKTDTPITIIKSEGNNVTLLYPGRDGCIGEITGTLKRVILNGGQDIDERTKGRGQIFLGQQQGGSVVSMAKSIQVSYIQWLIYQYLKEFAEKIVESSSSSDIFVSRIKSKGQKKCDWVKIGKVSNFKPALMESLKVSLADDFKLLGKNSTFTSLNVLKNKSLIHQLDDRVYIVNIEVKVDQPSKMSIQKSASSKEDASDEPVILDVVEYVIYQFYLQRAETSNAKPGDEVDVEENDSDCEIVGTYLTRVIGKRAEPVLENNDWLTARLRLMAKRGLFRLNTSRIFLIVGQKVECDEKVSIVRYRKEQAVQLTNIEAIAQSKFDDLQKSIAPARDFWNLIQAVLTHQIDPECRFATKLIELQEAIAIAHGEDLHELDTSIQAIELSMEQSCALINDILRAARNKTVTDNIE